jgi:hypothetical protein
MDRSWQGKAIRSDGLIDLLSIGRIWRNFNRDSARQSGWIYWPASILDSAVEAESARWRSPLRGGEASTAEFVFMVTKATRSQPSSPVWM